MLPAHCKLVLLDFDGLLVDTESTHHAAYEHTCAKLGAPLNWSFGTYTCRAHFSETGLGQHIARSDEKLAALPWEELYAMKKARFIELVEQQQSVRVRFRHCNALTHTVDI